MPSENVKKTTPPLPDKRQKAPVDLPAKTPIHDLYKYINAPEIILSRNYFYRDSYRRLMVVCLCLLIIIGFLTFFGIYESKHIPPPQYFATTFDGMPLPVIPLKEANMKPALLLEWAIEAAATINTFNFVNYRKSLQDSRGYFTRVGYQGFLHALKESNNLDAVQKRKMVVYAKVEEGSSPTILRDSDSDPELRTNGVYTWQVQVPMLLTYENAGQDKIEQRIVVEMLIVRISALESPKGIGINSYIGIETR